MIFIKKTIAPSRPPRGEEKSEEPLARRSQLVVSSEEWKPSEWFLSPSGELEGGFTFQNDN